MLSVCFYQLTLNRCCSLKITIKIEFMWSQMENKNIQNIVLPFRSLATLPRNIGKKIKVYFERATGGKGQRFFAGSIELRLTMCVHWLVGPHRQLNGGMSPNISRHLWSLTDETNFLWLSTTWSFVWNVRHLSFPGHQILLFFFCFCFFYQNTWCLEMHARRSLWC